MSDTIAAPERPKLLSVLCILSFLMGAFGIVIGSIDAFTDMPRRMAEKDRITHQEMIERNGPEVMESPEGKLIEDALSVPGRVALRAKQMGRSMLATSLLSVAGVWLMWSLRRIGFWLYLPASIGSMVSKIMFVVGEGLSATVIATAFIVISLAFIVLYATQLKHMR